MARVFNGSTDKITVNTTGAGFTTLSAACWIYPTSLAAAYSAPFGCPTAGIPNNGDIILAVKSNGKLAYFIRTNAGLFSSDGTGTRVVSINSWQHVGFRMSATDFNGYYNGLSDAPTAGSNFSGTPGEATMQIGTSDSNTWPFTGRIVDFTLWNAALTVNEFLALYGGARPQQIRRDKIVGWWPLDGIQSTEPDFSGKGNNGTLTGTSASAGPPVNFLSMV